MQTGGTWRIAEKSNRVGGIGQGQDGDLCPVPATQCQLGSHMVLLQSVEHTRTDQSLFGIGCQQHNLAGDRLNCSTGWKDVTESGEALSKWFRSEVAAAESLGEDPVAGES